MQMVRNELWIKKNESTTPTTRIKFGRNLGSHCVRRMEV